MIDTNRLNEILVQYKNVFKTEQWLDEKYKWEAVKWFQDNWNIDSPDFSDMLTRSLLKTYNLLASVNNFPRKMIQDFAKEFPEEVKAMFISLYDEKQDIVHRILEFKKQSEILLKKYGNGAKHHYQTENSISVYLWLRYPEKYYIYKYSEVLAVAEELNSNYQIKAGAYEANLRNFHMLYDEMREEIQKDSELINLMNTQRTDTCDSDNELRTLTTDIGFFISRKIKNQYWPSLDEYDPNLTTEKWIELLSDSTITNNNTLIMLYRILELGGESTCANLAKHYGGSAYAYSSYGRALGERIHKTTGCPLCNDEERERYYTIPFIGRSVVENGHNRYSWKLRNELKEALKSDMINKKAIEQLKKFKKIQYEKNMILYGPPGTGKTYYSAIYAVAICDGKNIDEVKDMNYDDVMNRYKELLNTNRIVFTTFHQSYGYEEFIEGVKPDVEDSNIRYILEDGIFKKFCNSAGASKIETKEFEVIEDASVWKTTIREVVRKDCFDKNRVRIDWSIDSDGAQGFTNDVKKGDIILTTDGSRRKINGIAVVTEDDAYDIGEKNDSTTRKVKWLAKNIDEDIVDINSGKILHRMTVARVPYMKVADILAVAKKYNPELSSTKIMDNKEPYVFIIDEINRGNISKIFGELITLIEDSKRDGMPEAMSAKLPYSGENFSVPSNVYIIGTMNTADRSIALMDTALRRRFQFVEMMPDVDVLRAIGADKVGELDVAEMLQTINKRIEFLYDREHTIGHAFFTKLAKNLSIDMLASIFEKSVIPLLQEYFYEDYQKIQFILGDNAKNNPDYKFIQDEKLEANKAFKGNAAEYLDLPDKQYTINKEAFQHIESYIEIYK